MQAKSNAINASCSWCNKKGQVEEASGLRLLGLDQKKFRQKIRSICLAIAEFRKKLCESGGTNFWGESP
jgi:hypothetical protein